MSLIPCRHLDYTEGKYGPDIELATEPSMRDASGNPVRFWFRGPTWTEPLFDGERPAPACVQFCGAGRGRINAIFDCYDGSMHCYEPAAADAESASRITQ